jgi:hypothetical protein
MPHGAAVKAYKKYIFQYIIGKMEYMDALMPQNMRRLFPFDWQGFGNAIVRHGTARETNKNIFSSDPLPSEAFRHQRVTWYGGIKRIRKI